MLFAETDPTKTTSLAIYGILGVFAYLAIVQILRYRKINSTFDRYLSTHAIRKSTNDGNPSDYPMTPAEAQRIIWVSSKWDAPFLVEKSLEFALFKTYGIESIAEILLKTGQLSKEDNVSRRYIDTAVLIQTWACVPITGPGSGLDKLPEGADPRGAIAIARTNWLHSKYKISNDDFLYTLSLFILEPAKWMEKYEWRSLTALERQAYFVFWAEIGRRMGIQNIPETIGELEQWCEEYEEAHMLPSPINEEVARWTIHLLLYHIPSFVKPIGEQAVAALCPDRLRVAIMAPKPSAWVVGLVSTALTARKLFLRHLCLPRFKSLDFIPGDTSGFSAGQVCPMGVSVCPVSSKPGAKSEAVYRLHPSYYHYDPWYRAQPSMKEQIKNWVLNALGLFNSKATHGPHFKPQGYRTEELGPISFEQSGRDAVRANAEAIYGGKITGPWAF